MLQSNSLLSFAKPASRFDYLLRTLRWFEHYLQGPGGDPPPYEIDYAKYLRWASPESAP